MRWFNKTGQTEVWDQKIEWPIGDIEAAHIIREICRSAADSAEQVGKFAARPDSKKKKSEVKQNKRESERYQHAAKAAMEIAMKVSDGLMRDDFCSPDRRSLHEGQQHQHGANAVSGHPGQVDQGRGAKGASDAAERVAVAAVGRCRSRA